MPIQSQIDPIRLHQKIIFAVPFHISSISSQVKVFMFTSDVFDVCDVIGRNISDKGLGCARLYTFLLKSARENPVCIFSVAICHWDWMCL